MSTWRKEFAQRQIQLPVISDQSSVIGHQPRLPAQARANLLLSSRVETMLVHYPLVRCTARRVALTRTQLMPKPSGGGSPPTSRNRLFLMLERAGMTRMLRSMLRTKMNGWMLLQRRSPRHKLTCDRSEKLPKRKQSHGHQQHLLWTQLLQGHRECSWLPRLRGPIFHVPRMSNGQGYWCGG